MRLLGFDSAHEEKVKVALGKDIFAHINKKGSEVVLHFLFSRLDSHTAYEEFRYENPGETDKPRSMHLGGGGGGGGGGLCDDLYLTVN